jgi:hypothetical protein
MNFLIYDLEFCHQSKNMDINNEHESCSPFVVENHPISKLLFKELRAKNIAARFESWQEFFSA